MKFISFAGKLLTGLSRPARGAWIEIFQLFCTIVILNSRAPRGVRGLKYVDQLFFCLVELVAPREGCVD